MSIIAILNGGGSIPPAPSRDRRCSIRISFQGLSINSPTYSPRYGGPLPWFTAALGAMDAVGELESTLNQLQAAGDTHAQADLIFTYGEAGQPWGTPQLVPDCDLSNDLPRYCRIVDAIIARGMIPIFVMPSEGQAGLEWTYNELARIVAALGWRVRYGIFQYAYDGGWPAGWSAAQTRDFIVWQRSIIGDDGCALLYFANGPQGSPYLIVFTEDDYAQPWMQCLDVVLTSTTADQLACPSLPNYAQYMLGSNLTPTLTCAPSFDAPAHIRNVPQGMMHPGTPRGPYYWGIIEWNEYNWVRNRVTAWDIEVARARAFSVGVRVLG